MLQSIKKTAVIALMVMIPLSACMQTNQSDMKSNQHYIKDTIVKTDNEWKKELSGEQYYVLREKGTESPYSGKLLLNKEEGIYKCAACGNELFTDKMKFDSHCGWPSFDREIEGGKIKTEEDRSHGMVRTEIMCARCGGHLGHLFDDGPTQTGMRYCVNSLSLEFVPEKEVLKDSNNHIDTLVLGGGCYWCVEAVYEMLKGVKSVESGFAGGFVKNPSYHDVCSGTTGHAEVVRITYDNTEVSFKEILEVFFTVHDPTTLNRQGADVGTQYRSVIFYNNQEEFNLAKKIIDDLNKEKVYTNPVVTQLEKSTVFYKAEDYHQNYYAENQSAPYCTMVIQPKLEKFKKVFGDKIK